MKGSARIILFDQDTESRTQAAACLAGRGYKLAQFSTSDETLAAVRRLPADIVLLDLDVNEIHGMEIIMEAKANNPEISIILMGTQDAAERNPNMLMFAGYEFVLKPLREDVLGTAIEQRLNQQHLYRICSALSTELDVNNVLNVLLRSTLQEVDADQAVVLLRDDSSDRLRVEAAAGLPEGIVGTTCEADDAGIVGLVFANNEPIVSQGGFARLPFIPEELNREIESSICVPIRIGGKTIGMLNVNRLGVSEPFCQSQLRTVEIVALQTAVAVQNARAHHYALERQRMEHELELARAIQQSLFPKISGYERYADIVSENIPANMVGGDFFDFVELDPDRFGVVIGDVAGKGIPGALLMVRAISNFRLRARPGQEPGKVLGELNNDLIESNTHGMYVTAIYAVFDFGRGVLRFANAGHPPLFLCRSSSETLECFDASSGIPMGILKDTRYETAELPLEPGCLAFLYTDGIIEARNPDRDDFSLARLKRLVNVRPLHARKLCECVMGELMAFTAGRPHHDDLTLLAVGVKHTA